MGIVEAGIAVEALLRCPARFAYRNYARSARFSSLPFALRGRG